MLKFATLALNVLALNPSVEGFSVTSNTRLDLFIRSTPLNISPSYSTSRKYVVLSASEESETELDDSADEVSAEVAGDEEHEVVEEEPESEVDEELEAIKKEISDLENTLKNKNRELNSIEKMGEQYTKGGYARKVAELEQFRKLRSAASADSKVTAKASVLQNFLPIVDELKILTEKYEGDEFAKKYAAISWDFNNALKDMGVTEYSVAEGDIADTSRVNAFEEEYSQSVAKGCVIRGLENGYEIDGNVMRMAAAVVSLGCETEETEEAPEDEEEQGDESA